MLSISFRGSGQNTKGSFRKTKNQLSNSETNKAQKKLRGLLIRRVRYPSLVWALIATFWKKLALSGVFRLLRDMLIFVGPLLLRYDDKIISPLSL